MVALLPRGGPIDKMRSILSIGVVDGRAMLSLTNESLHKYIKGIVASQNVPDGT